MQSCEFYDVVWVGTIQPIQGLSRTTGEQEEVFSAFPASLLSRDTPSVLSGPHISIYTISIYGSWDFRLELDFHHQLSHDSDLQIDGRLEDFSAAMIAETNSSFWTTYNIYSHVYTNK